MRKHLGTPAALLALALAACGGVDTGGKGQISIALSSSATTATSTTTPDGHCPALQAASVTLSSILARTLDGVLVDVTVHLPVTEDLLALEGGKEVTLPLGYLPPGTYDQFVVVVTGVELTLASGTKIAITPPGGGWTAIVPVANPFTVVEGKTTAVTLKFRRDLSFACGMGHWEFEPRFDCDGEDGGHHHP